MSNHNVIVVSAPPLGHFIEGVLAPGNLPKPGHIVQIKVGATLVDGRPQYEMYNKGADGKRAEIVVVRENDLIGKTVDDAYTDSARFFGYIPAKGDEIQVRFANVGTGTGAGQEDINVGDRMIIDDTTGNVVESTGTPEAEPFVALETIQNITEDKRVLVRVL